MTDNRKTNSLFKRGFGAGCFVCESCGKQTRDTGNDEKTYRMCKLCILRSYMENAESDYGVDSEEHKRARAAYVAAGGDVA